MWLLQKMIIMVSLSFYVTDYRGKLWYIDKILPLTTDLRHSRSISFETNSDSERNDRVYISGEVRGRGLISRRGELPELMAPKRGRPARGLGNKSPNLPDISESLTDDATASL